MRFTVRGIVSGLALYVMAKVFEMADRSMLDTTRIASGHTLKHVAAAAAVASIGAMLHARFRSTGQ